VRVLTPDDHPLPLFIPAARPANAVRRRRTRPGDRAEAVIAFIEGLRITAGAHAGRPFLLRPWQRDIVRRLYAVDGTGKRIVRQSLITMARKNGKTQLAAALALAHLCGPEAEPRGQVFSAAADRDQAALIFREMKAFIAADPALAGRVIVRDFAKQLEDVVTSSVYQALSSDARKAHGLSPSFYIADELAQWPNRHLLDNLSTGVGARAEPLGIVISTQSADPFSAMAELVRYGEAVRDGTIVDPTFAPFIFALPMTADPWDEAAWPLANPALGDFRSLEEMRTAAEQAKRIPARESVFRNLYLNQAVEPDERFIHGSDWDACGAPFDPAELQGERCVAGLDLGSTADLTGLALWFPERRRLLVWGFLPAAGLDAKEREDRAPYRQWRDQGCVIATPGRAISKVWVAAKLRELASLYRLEAVAFDRWAFKDLEMQCEAEGIALPFVPHGQGFKDMAPSVNEFERLVLEGELGHGGNPLLRWCLSNASVETDPAGGRKITKARSRGRVDPLVAAIMAVGQAARLPATPTYAAVGWV
jgi:phage terminase large subunit-like protein